MSGQVLRVALDVSAIPDRAAGAGQYVLALVGALDRRDEVELTLIARRGDRWRWQERSGRATVLDCAPTPRPVRLAWEQLGLPRRLSHGRFDLHHGPHYTMPERARLPRVVTVHDCTFFDHPEWHQPTKVRLFQRALQVAADRAAAVICVSARTAERFVAHCRPRAPVVVAPHGIDRSRFGPEEPEPGSDAAQLARLGLDPDRPMVVYVGTLEPRKGVPILVRAFDALAERFGDVQLVLAGQAGWLERDPRTATGHPDRVVVTGYLPDAAVPALYRRAAVVAYPSLDEGFGLPAFEAAACGAPVVTTSGTPMADGLGDAALVVKPGDPHELADALASVLEGDPAALDRRRVGFERVAGLTWEASVARHLEAYRIAAA
jgi:glycosyltransferase involved in cell wall biosynthesis